MDLIIRFSGSTVCINEEEGSASEPRKNMFFNCLSSESIAGKLKNWKVILFLLVLVTVTSVGTASMLIWMKHSSKELNNIYLNYHGKLFYNDGKNLNYYDLATNKTSTYYETQSNISMFDVTKTMIYWIEEDKKTIHCYNETSHSIVYIRYTGIKPTALAVDSFNKKFYLVDATAGTVDVVDFGGKQRIILIDLWCPSDIHLDIKESLVFVVEWKRSIIRSNMDGTDRRLFANSHVAESPVSMTLDRGNKMIYWSDGYGEINSMDYTGRFVKQVWRKVLMIWYKSEKDNLNHLMLEDSINGLKIKSFDYYVKSMTYFDSELSWLMIDETNRTLPMEMISCQIFNGTCIFSSVRESLMIKNKQEVSLKSFSDKFVVEGWRYDPCEDVDCPKLCAEGLVKNMWACKNDTYFKRRPIFERTSDKPLCKLVSP